MNKEPRVVLDGEFEEVIERDDHYYVKSKFDRVCIVPYTVSGDGLLSEIGVVETWNDEEKQKSLTLVTGFLNQDDATNLVGANRVLYEVTGNNSPDASKWMYLGSVYNSLTSDSPIRIYGVNVTDSDLEEEVQNPELKRHFKLMESSRVVQSDDLLFLGAFTRLFNFFYTNSLK